MDELHGFFLPPPRALPIDLAFNRPMKATRAAVELLHRYPHVRVRQGEIEPGDLVLVRVTEKGVGHAFIVGTNTKTLWHCDGGKVWYTGIGPWSKKIVGVFRAKYREDWK